MAIHPKWGDAVAQCRTQQPHPKIEIILFFCAVSDAAVASDTENHGSCKQTFKNQSAAIAYVECQTPILGTIYQKKSY
jgi:hypothetical protein